MNSHPSAWAEAGPLILTVAPNGAYKTARDHPDVPTTPQDLARTARQCLDAGAAMIHMHIRDAAGRHLLDASGYREATRAVRAAVGQALVIQITSEAAGLYEPAQQMAVVRETRPEAVSIGLREIDTPQVGERELGAFFGWLAQERVMTQVILYDAADVLRWQALRESGVVPEAPWFLLFVLGRYTAGQVSTPRDLLPFLAAHPAHRPEPWAVCAFGPGENACALAAAALGGHARVGFENNLRRANGELAAGNAVLVADLAAGARALQRPLADADAVRQRFLGAAQP